MDYFVDLNREWIVGNLHKIYSMSELMQNNGEIVNKYKKYKSLFKQQKIH